MHRCSNSESSEAGVPSWSFHVACWPRTIGHIYIWSGAPIRHSVTALRSEDSVEFGLLASEPLNDLPEPADGQLMGIKLGRINIPVLEGFSP